MAPVEDAREAWMGHWEPERQPLKTDDWGALRTISQANVRGGYFTAAKPPTQLAAARSSQLPSGHSNGIPQTDDSGTSMGCYACAYA